jgi:hypothetical protein
MGFAGTMLAGAATMTACSGTTVTSVGGCCGGTVVQPARTTKRNAPNFPHFDTPLLCGSKLLTQEVLQVSG